MEFANRAGMIHCWNEASGVQTREVWRAAALSKRFKEQREVWKTSWWWVPESLPRARWKGLVGTKGLAGVRPTACQVLSLPRCRLPSKRKRLPVAFWGRSALCWTRGPGAAVACEVLEIRGCCLVARSCEMNYSPPSSSVHGTSQARVLEWVAISFSRGSSRLRDQSHVACIGRRIIYQG